MSTGREYKGRDNYGRPKTKYLDKVRDMNDEDLRAETESMIYMSAWAGNNPQSDFHWQCDACYDECARREGDIYAGAYSSVERQVMGGGEDPR